MLLGYFSEIVGDRQLAEQHLVNIFNSIPQHLNEINSGGANTWCHLQRLAKKQLSGSFVTDGDGLGNSAQQRKNKFIDRMTSEQQLVFCSIYYNGITIQQLAKELDKTEESIRTALRGAFAIIKTGA
jgi:DNA-directed RNA polymerase specialized sigma24 family protein